jgi:hypothetical protein
MTPSRRSTTTLRRTASVAGRKRFTATEPTVLLVLDIADFRELAGRRPEVVNLIEIEGKRRRAANVATNKRENVPHQECVQLYRSNEPSIISISGSKWALVLADRTAMSTIG